MSASLSTRSTALSLDQLPVLLPERIVSESLAILDRRGKAGRAPELWDGRAAKRIVAVLR